MRVIYLLIVFSNPNVAIESESLELCNMMAQARIKSGIPKEDVFCIDALLKTPRINAA